MGEGARDSGPVRVVLVDDSPMVLEMLRIAASTTPGLEVVGEAGDGRDAIEVCARTRPDAVLLDVEMPILDGLSAIGPIREASPATTIVMFSCDATKERDARAAGAHAYFVKGDVNPVEVLEALVAGDPPPFRQAEGSRSPA